MTVGPGGSIAYEKSVLWPIVKLTHIYRECKVDREGRGDSSLITTFNNSPLASFFDPLGRPTITAGSDRCFHTCCPSVRTNVRPHFSKSSKTKQISGENSDRSWGDCGSGRVDHWWHLSCLPSFFCSSHMPNPLSFLPPNILARKCSFKSWWAKYTFQSWDYFFFSAIYQIVWELRNVLLDHYGREKLLNYWKKWNIDPQGPRIDGHYFYTWCSSVRKTKSSLKQNTWKH